MNVCPVCDTGMFIKMVDGKVEMSDTCGSCGYVYNRKDDNPIKQFCIDVIEGIGGMDAFEYHEMATPTIRREIAVAQWVIRCLANPDNPLSREVLRLIEERRNEQK